MNGGGNYGPSRQLPGKPRDVYAIMGYGLDENGDTYYSSSPNSFLVTLVHEFNHSFVNPLATDKRFSNQMEDAGKDILKLSEQVMRRSAYGKWDNLVNESIVRAAVIRYLIDNNYPEDKVRESVINEMSVGFYWTPELVKSLTEYSSNRDRYPSIDTFYPNLIKFFRTYADSQFEEIDSIFTTEISK